MTPVRKRKLIIAIVELVFWSVCVVVGMYFIKLSKPAVMNFLSIFGG